MINYDLIIQAIQALTNREEESASFEAIKDYLVKQGIEIEISKLLDTLYKMCEEGMIIEDRNLPLWFRLITVPETWEEVANAVDEYRIYPADEEDYYEIVIKNKIIKLDSREILSSKIFRKEYYRAFGILLPTLKNEKWCELINIWTKNKGVYKHLKREEVGHDRAAMDVVINHIITAQLVKGLPKKTERGMVYVDGSRIFVPNSEISRILERHKIMINLRKLAYLLKNFIADTTKVVRTTDGLVRMWVFDANALGLDVSKAVEIEKDEEDERGNFWIGWHGKNDSTPE